MSLQHTKDVNATKQHRISGHMYVCMYLCVRESGRERKRESVCVCVRVYTRPNLHTNVHAYKYIYMCERVYVCTNMCMSALHMYMHACTGVLVCWCVGAQK